MADLVMPTRLATLAVPCASVPSLSTGFAFDVSFAEEAKPHGAMGKNTASTTDIS